jgi:hypothetical protein
MNISVIVFWLLFFNHQNERFYILNKTILIKKNQLRIKFNIYKQNKNGFLVQFE